ncbi:MAG: hypothetical protein KIT83_01835 [Bryobacterales bacterium]|nr:hypothetical protein [Bryobacterales bacterium]
MIRATSNTSVDPRTGTVRVAGQTVTVEQSVAPCTVQVQPPEVNIGNAAATIELAATPSVPCRYVSNSSVPWLTVVGSGRKAMQTKPSR